MRAIGVVAATGLVADSAGAATRSNLQERGGRENRGGFEVELELDGEPVIGWSAVDLPANRTVSDGRDDDAEDPDRPDREARTEWDDLTMTRGAKQGEKMLWDWRDGVIAEGPGGVEKKTITVSLFDKKHDKVAAYEFEGAWPRAYEPGRASGDGDSAMGQEELTIAYDRYKRTT